MKHRYLYFTVFASGMTTLAIELAASRLIGSVFGTSNLVWASIIGLILIYLTIGYFLGGWWADRSPFPGTFYQILAWGAFTSGVIPFLSRPVLRFAADAFDQLDIGILFGSFSVVLVIFVIPVTLLGTISPFAIRLALRDSREAGKVAGRVYAISTLGSFLGTFLPVLVLIPLVGTTFTFLFFGYFLLLVSFIGLWRTNGWKSVFLLGWMLIILVILGIFWGSGTIKKTTGQIYETESSYNYIQVLEIDDYRYLRLNEGQGVHSIYHPEKMIYYGPWMQVLAAPFFNKYPYQPANIKRVAIVGLAAGTIARQVTEVFGPIPIDGFEIDPKIIIVGRDYFDMNMKNLNAIAADGRWGLAQSDKQYTIISIDAYRPPYIPWHMTTKEFFQIVYDRLSNDGVMVINIGRAPDDRGLIDGLGGTIGSVFPSFYVIDIPDTFNSIIYATKQPTAIENIYENYNYLINEDSIHPFLLISINRAISNISNQPKTDIVFTDDIAPIEWLTNKMVLNFVLWGGIEDLQ